MANTKTTIELNGKLYDALTGKPVEATKPAVKAAFKASVQPVAKPAPKATQKVTATSKGVNVDGFMRAKPTVKAASGRTARTNTPVRRHKPQHPQTLMRRAVHKPAPTPAPKVAAVKSTPKAPQPSLSALSRQKRAAEVTKSAAISRFRKQPATVVNKTVAVLPVQPAPAHKPTSQQQAANNSTTVFAQQLKSSTSHKASKLKKPKTLKNSTKIAVLSVSVLMLGSFMAYRSIPSASVKMASARAGFSAELPSYVPAGFSLSDAIAASPGQVILNFTSNTDSRNYKVTQKPSEWNSSSLLSNYVEPNHKNFQTLYEAGKTIYLYDQSNATWVSNGIWYVVEGQSSLTSSQLVKIVNSL